MCDKLKNQQELAIEMANIIHSLDEQKALFFFSRFYFTMQREWPGIDKWRTDKFYFLSHQILYNTFLYLKNHNWGEKMIEKFMSSINSPNSILDPNYTRCLSVKLDMVQYYLKMLISLFTSESEVPSTEILFKIFDPLFQLLLKEKNFQVRKRLDEHFFSVLLQNWENHLAAKRPALPKKSKKNRKNQEGEEEQQNEKEEEKNISEIDSQFVLLIDLDKFTLQISKFCMDENINEGCRKTIFHLRNKLNLLLEEHSGKKLDLSVVIPEKRKAPSNDDHSNDSKIETLSKHHFPSLDFDVDDEGDQEDEDYLGQDDFKDVKFSFLPSGTPSPKSKKLRKLLSSTKIRRRLTIPSSPKTSFLPKPSLDDQFSESSQNFEDDKTPDINANKTIKSALRKQKGSRKSVTWSEKNQKVVFLPKCSPNTPPSQNFTQPHQEVKSPDSNFSKILQKNLLYLSQLNLNRGKKRRVVQNDFDEY